MSGGAWVLFFLAGMIGLMGWLYTRNAAARYFEAWKRFATARQLSYDEGRLAGVVNGLTVAVLLEARGSGEDERKVVVVRCSLGGALPADFALAKETLYDKVKQLMSGPDHQVGDPKLDSAFLLDGVGDEARRVLGNRRAQEALLAALERYPNLRIGNGAVQLEREKVPTTEEELAHLLNDAVTLATVLQRAAQAG